MKAKGAEKIEGPGIRDYRLATPCLCRLCAKDRPYHRFLWLELITRETLMSMSSIEFYSGIRHRPFCAQFILQTHA